MSEHTDPTRERREPRAPYEPPRLTVLGTLRELTQSGTGSFADATNTADQMGSGVISDRRLKRKVRALDADAVLDAVRSLRVSSWSYLWEDQGVRHIGPMAQDFAAAFAVGADDRHISPLDANGVALAAIQALADRVEALERELEAVRNSLPSGVGSSG